MGKNTLSDVSIQATRAAGVNVGTMAPPPLVDVDVDAVEQPLIEVETV